MREIPQDRRTTRLVSVVAIADPNGEIIYGDTADIAGFIPLKASPVIVQGYPFKLVLVIPEFDRTFSELSQEEQDRIAVRGRLAKKLIFFKT